MSTIIPEGQALRKAIQWISDMKKQDPEKSLQQLVDEAGTRFDLSPKDSEFLLNFYLHPKSK